jgi:hypothetical protein
MSHKIVSNLFIYARQEQAENLVISRKNKHLIFNYYFPTNEQKSLSLPPKYAASFFKHLYQDLGLKPDELVSQKPGEFSYQNHFFKFLTSTIPDQEGEKIIIHFRNSGKQLEKNWRLNELGLQKKDATEIRAVLGSKTGLILIAGTADSGKSATLNSLIREINLDKHNICFLYNQKTPETTGVNYLKLSLPKIASLKKYDTDIVAIDEINSAAVLNEALTLAHNGKLVLATIKAEDQKELAERIKKAPLRSNEKISALKMIIFQKIVKLTRQITNKKDQRQKIGRFQIIDFRKK